MLTFLIRLLGADFGAQHTLHLSLSQTEAETCMAESLRRFLSH